MTGGSPTPRRYGGLSADERRERRRSLLLDAGLQVFGTTGYRTATARDICQRAGLTDRYFHESFASMEDLLIAVYQAQVAGLEADITEVYAAHAERGLADLVPALLDAYFTFARDVKVARVIWLEVLGVSPRVDQTYLAGMRTFIGFITMVIFANPEVAPVVAQTTVEEIRVVATGFVGALDESTRLWLLDDYATPQQTMVAGLSRLMLAVGGL